MKTVPQEYMGIQRELHTDHKTTTITSNNYKSFLKFKFLSIRVSFGTRSVSPYTRSVPGKLRRWYDSGSGICVNLLRAGLSGAWTNFSVLIICSTGKTTSSLVYGWCFLLLYFWNAVQILSRSTSENCKTIIETFDGKLESKRSIIAKSCKDLQSWLSRQDQSIGSFGEPILSIHLFFSIQA